MTNRRPKKTEDTGTRGPSIASPAKAAPKGVSGTVEDFLAWAASERRLFNDPTNDPPERASGLLLVEEVKERLLNAILKGEFPPGSRLPEQELASRFGVSRGPVREALFNLAREEIVELNPRRGAVVTQISPKTIHDLYDLRAVLFGFTCRLATGALDDAKIARLREGLGHLRAMASDPERTSLEFLEVRNAIATVISVVAGNRILFMARHRLSRRALLYNTVLDSLERRIEAVRSWSALIDAFEAKDASLAEALAVRQVTASRDEILRVTGAPDVARSADS